MSKYFFTPHPNNVIMKILCMYSLKDFCNVRRKSSKASYPQGGIQRTVFFLFNVVEFMVLYIIRIFFQLQIFFLLFHFKFREWFENRWIGREEATSYYKVKEVHAYEHYSKWCYKWRRLFQEYLKHLVEYCNSYSFLLLPKCLPKNTVLWNFSIVLCSPKTFSCTNLLFKMLFTTFTCSSKCDVFYANSCHINHFKDLKKFE